MSDAEPEPGVFATAGVFSVALGAVALVASPSPLFGTVALGAGIICFAVDGIARRPTATTETTQR